MQQKLFVFQTSTAKALSCTDYEIIITKRIITHSLMELSPS
jgi:hypothetical protein